jgi:hypothetical protein
MVQKEKNKTRMVNIMAAQGLDISNSHTPKSVFNPNQRLPPSRFKKSN